jgi:hypothetical protein
MFNGTKLQVSDFIGVLLQNFVLLRTAVPQTRGRAVDQTVNRRPFNSDSPFRMKTGPRGICHGRGVSRSVTLSEAVLIFVYYSSTLEVV